MAKNVLARTLLKTKDQAYTEGVWEGVQLCLNIVAIALNHTYGFGEKRLSRLEAKVQDLFDELVDTNDPLVNKVHIEKAVRQIRKGAWNDG
jgi:high-affinity Fe2+/Pb2+ permease